MGISWVVGVVLGMRILFSFAFSWMGILVQSLDGAVMHMKTDDINDEI